MQKYVILKMKIPDCLFKTLIEMYDLSNSIQDKLIKLRKCYGTEI